MHAPYIPPSVRAVLALLAAAAFAPLSIPSAIASDNLLRDPGFEQYHYDDDLGYYVPNQRAAWEEITLGRASVRFDGSDWTAPDEMLWEQPLGFSPGTTGYEGTGADQNTGRIILHQDVVNPSALLGGERYEAWVWFAGTGNDNDTSIDLKDEIAGWEIWFYGGADTSQWTEENALEHHHAERNLSAPPGTFERVSGFGKIPEAAAGFRIRVWASAWATANLPAAYDTAVAIDNAHFAILDHPNLLTNGDFEMDTDLNRMFRFWSRPAKYPFPLSGFTPIDLGNVYGENFDHGQLRPFYGGLRVYGYETWLCGWFDDAFTFGQSVDVDIDDGQALTLMLYWMYALKTPGEVQQFRERHADVDLVVEYFAGVEQVGTESFEVLWPVPTHPDNDCRYDFNGGIAYNPRFQIVPPDGTDRVALHVSVGTYGLPWLISHFSHGVDEFWLGVSEVQPPPPIPTGEVLELR